MIIEELHPAVGTLVRDIDLRTQPTTAEVEQLREAFRTTYLLVVPEQDLTPDQQVSFVSLFGTVRRPNRDGAQHAYISNEREGGLAGDGRLLFHSDGSFFDTPVWALSLYGEEVTKTSPPTVFSNSVRAARTLPDGVRKQLDELDAVFIHDLSSWDEGHRIREQDLPEDTDRSKIARAVRPAILKDYEGLPPVLTVNELFTSHFVGLDPDDSEKLRNEVLDHALAEDNLYEHVWNRGDLILWNNVALQHGRPPHPRDPEPRTLRRVVVTSP